MKDNPVSDRIGATIAENDVVLFMKGTPKFPQCRFSAVVAQALFQLSVPFTAVNVLEDDTLRQGIKDYSNWPTIPQLYVKGDFIGGCDIVQEMYKSGELRQLLQDRNITSQGHGG